MAEAFNYNDVIFTVLFLIAVFALGKVAECLKMPSIVGEIIAGMLLGPYVANLVPNHLENNYQVRSVGALQLLGEIGLMLMVIEAGLEVELPVLKQIGVRGLLIGVVGSFLPLALGFLIANYGFNFKWQSSIAAGAVLSPTSMGIALVVLKQGGVLNTPTGQLVVASAVIDDVIALVILSLLQALVNPSVVAFVVPIVSALAFTIAVGAFAVWVMPVFLTRVFLRYMPSRYVEDGLIGMILLFAVGLSAALHYGKASYLFGAFLAGLCFCTAHSVELIWQRQVKRILKWLLRIFFACTVGFSIPANEFTNPRVVTMGLAFFTAIIGKLAMGLFAYPLTIHSFLVVGFAMSAWGEFAFIVASSAHAMLLLDDDLYSASLFAVLLSVIIGPYALRLTLLMKARQKKRELQFAKDAMERSLKRSSLDAEGKFPADDRGICGRPLPSPTTHGLRRKSIVFIDATDEEGVTRSVTKRRSERVLAKRDDTSGEPPGAIFYKLDVRTKLAWGLMSRLLRVISDLGLEVVEFRADTNHDGTEALYEAFLKDTVLRDTDPHTPEAEGLINRLHALRERMLETIRLSDPDAVDAHAQHLIPHTSPPPRSIADEDEERDELDGRRSKMGDEEEEYFSDVDEVLESTDDAVAVVVHSKAPVEPAGAEARRRSTSSSGGTGGGGGGGGGHVLILDGRVDYSRLHGLHLVRWLPGVDTEQWLEFAHDDTLAHDIVMQHIGHGVLATLHHHAQHGAAKHKVDAQIYQTLLKEDRMHAAEKLRNDPHGLRSLSLNILDRRDDGGADDDEASNEPQPPPEPQPQH